MNHRKMWLIVAVLVFASILCSCEKKANPDTTFPTHPQDDSTQASATQDTNATENTEPAEQVTVYPGAVEDYLLPLSEFSWERLYQPEFVMVHFTSAVVSNRDDPYNMDTIRSIFVDNEVSVHYMIERDGTVRCYIPEDRVAWHAGAGTYQENPKYTNTMNQYAIGIELVAIGSQDDMQMYLTEAEYTQLDQPVGFTQEQYDSLRALVADICGRYEIPMDRGHIIGHEDYSKHKSDPGELFDWTKILP